LNRLGKITKALSAWAAPLKNTPDADTTKSYVNELIDGEGGLQQSVADDGSDYGRR
jgi:hypothetical protein